MFENIDGSMLVFLMANAAGVIAAVRAWVHSKAAKELLDELIEDVSERLRLEMADAIAEGSAQVIAEIKRHLEPPAVKQ